MQALLLVRGHPQYDANVQLPGRHYICQIFFLTVYEQVETLFDLHLLHQMAKCKNLNIDFSCLSLKFYNQIIKNYCNWH